MQRWVSKALAALTCFILPMLCTLLPRILSESRWCSPERHPRQRVLLSRLMCLGGGIFFGTYLLHMGPDVRHLLDQALLVPYEINYPLTELFTGIGFFLVLLTETIVAQLNDRRHRSKPPVTIVSMTEIEKSTISSDGTHNNANNSRTLTVPSGPDVDTSHRNNHRHQQLLHGDSDVGKPLNGRHDDETHQAMQPEVNGQPEPVGGHAHDQLHGARSLALVLALSLHRIFEGMSVGLQHTSYGVGNLLLAVMCHETVIAFSLGLQFVRSNLAVKRFYVTSLVCSIIMPIGVVIGIIMSESVSQGDSNQLSPGPMLIAVGVLQAIAVGTFIYVTFFEILSEELADHSSVGKVLFVVVGFMLMALLDLVPEEQIQIQQSPQHMDFSSNSSGLLTSNSTS